MFGLSPLPRTLEAALRDAAHDKLHVRRSAMADLRRHCDGSERTRCVALLEQRLRVEPSQQLASELALCLADVEATQSLPALLARQGELGEKARASCLVAIGELATRGDQRCAAALESAWGTEYPELRFQALIAAARVLEFPTLAVWLQTALEAADPHLRHIACRIAEEQFLSPSAGLAAADARVPSLTQSIENKLLDDDRRVRAAAAVALAPLGVAKARDTIVEVLTAPGPIEPDDEHAVIELCGKLRLSAAVPALRKRAEPAWWRTTDPLRFPVLASLARLGDTASKLRIVAELRSSRAARRNQAAQAAGAAQIEEAREELVRLQRHDHDSDASAAGEALRALDRAKHRL